MTLRHVRCTRCAPVSIALRSISRSRDSWFAKCNMNRRVRLVTAIATSTLATSLSRRARVASASPTMNLGGLALAAAIVTRGSSVAATTGGLAWPKLAAAAWLPLPTRKFALLTAVVAVVAWVLRVLNTPSRVYDREQNTVGREYDAWTSEGILEYYWGEHIHLGYYGEDERRAPFYGGKDFVEAKYDFIDKMLEFSKVRAIRPRKSAAQCCANSARLCAIL